MPADLNSAGHKRTAVLPRVHEALRVIGQQRACLETGGCTVDRVERVPRKAVSSTVVPKMSSNDKKLPDTVWRLVRHHSREALWQG
ncbi:hypothetical protein MRX96_011423 [Rhipicephalus microplus]